METENTHGHFRKNCGSSLRAYRAPFGKDAGAYFFLSGTPSFQPTNPLNAMFVVCGPLAWIAWARFCSLREGFGPK